MVTDINAALNAYRTAAERVIEPSAPQEETAPHGTFAALVKSAVDEAIADNKKAEIKSMQAIKGTADMQDVVMAVSNAETALQTVVAVRDKVVTAYQEILQMPI